MTIARGATLGPYRILSHIGQGGMGEVWRARDSRIGRDVAVKVLPEAFREGDDRVRRFEQEARAAGALNHPGLVTIFDVGTTAGQPYIVMELLEGQTLRDVIGKAASAPLPLRTAIEYGMQIAAALTVAHEKGIIHRDLKPENIFLTSDGRLKILDFGLAKLAENDSQDQTAPYRKPLTSAGLVVGTPAYMSPEQARAEPLDHRTDIFAFGTVLYEMLSGVSPFDGHSAVETMHAVLFYDPPPLSERNPKIPPALDAIVRHCLEKTPRARCQSARDLGFQLQLFREVQKSAGAFQPDARAKRPRITRAIAVAAIVLPIVAAGAYLLGRMGAGAPATTPRVFKQLTFADGLEILPAFSPDGNMVAYVAGTSGRRDIYVQRVDGYLATNLTADSPEDDSEPAFSPDGSQIAFRSERDGGGIFVMGVTGESVRRLTDFGHNPSWSADGTRLAVSTAGTELRPQMHPLDGDLWVVDINGGAKRLLVKARTAEFGADAMQPSWSPHGSRIAFWGVSSQPRGQYELWTVDPDAPQPAKSIVRASSDAAIHWNPVWSPDGQYLYYGCNRDGTMNLWRVAIDEKSGKTKGPPEPSSLPGAMNGNFSFSRQGALVYATAGRSHHVLTASFDPKALELGPMQPLLGGAQQLFSFEPSPDGQTVAFATGGVQEDLFVANRDGSRLRQLTNDAARDRSVIWSPDGKTLYFFSNRDGVNRIWSIRADGSDLTCVTTAADFQRAGIHQLYEPNVSPDGRTLVAQAEPDMAMLVHLDRPLGQRLEPLDRRINTARWSPDGKRLIGTFITDANTWGGIALYSLATRRVERILDEGHVPQWFPDGKHVIFFEDAAVGVLDVDTRQVATKRVALPAGMEWDGQRRLPYLARDGSMLYLHKTSEQGDIWMLGREKNDGGR